MDHAYNDGLSFTVLAAPPSGCTAVRMKRVTLAIALCAALGVQMGSESLTPSMWTSRAARGSDDRMAT